RAEERGMIERELLAARQQQYELQRAQKATTKAGLEEQEIMRQKIKRDVEARIMMLKELQNNNGEQEKALAFLELRQRQDTINSPLFEQKIKEERKEMLNNSAIRLETELITQKEIQLQLKKELLA